ncbi:uncharacterized protein F5147DRAFT_344514 [Suillus discolor]|uniref:Uncharacterized protein n=1 Tax=Suillus discolor TaxID=1912936 RepID=A0A9P7FES2_9AGAM|nr:uncharacterized protein F5147DRAFT_344514 [Suillus discolor]KAG2116425.1 hypothetical protein F5147DRAFT_344514 [Suillus discolor]
MAALHSAAQDIDSSESSEHYALFVQTQPTGCSCGESRQTREHILHDCRLFTHQRNHLHAVTHDIILSMTLGVAKEIAAQVKFIQESDAFKVFVLGPERAVTFVNTNPWS